MEIPLAAGLSVRELPVDRRATIRDLAPQSVPGALSHDFTVVLRRDEHEIFWFCTGCVRLVERFTAHACAADGKSG